jgi:hypothetical protein
MRLLYRASSFHLQMPSGAGLKTASAQDPNQLCQAGSWGDHDMLAAGLLALAGVYFCIGRAQQCSCPKMNMHPNVRISFRSIEALSGYTFSRKHESQKKIRKSGIQT